MPKAEDIEFLAGQLLPQFIPKDSSAMSFSFQFTIAPVTTYRVDFAKTTTKGKDSWKLIGYEEVGS